MAAIPIGITIVGILGWLIKYIILAIKWFVPAIARVISSGWVIAAVSLFAISSWAFSSWETICSAVSGYIDGVTDVINSLHFSTGVPWIDGFMGFFALDSFASCLVSFVAFFLPLVASVVLGVFVTIVGFALKLIVYKITAAATRDLGKT